MPDEQVAESQWLTIEDFSAGIWTAPGIKRIDSTGFYSGPFNTPMGAARLGTYGCLPGPGGKGLVPGIWSPVAGDDADFQYRFTRANLSDANNNPPFQMSAFTLLHFASGTVLPFLAVVYLSSAGSPRMTYKLMRDTTNVYTVTAFGAGTKYFGTYLPFTRVNVVSPYVSPGQPVVVPSFKIPGITGMESGVIFPDPSAPTADGTMEIDTLVGSILTYPGTPIVHQNRILLMTETGSALKMGTSSAFADTDEGFFVTNPPNTPYLAPTVAGGATAQGFGVYAENASGFAAWGSLSASSLILIKRSGGAVLLQGDVLSPQITYLPGVQPTGNWMSVPCVCPLGVIYASEGAGVWAWQGGATSIKLSRQLEDSFIRDNQTEVLNFFEDGTGEAMFGPSFQALYYNELLFCTGGWIYHTPTESWWRLDSESGVNASGDTQHMWYQVNPYGELGAELWAIHPVAQLVSGTTYRAGYKYPLNKYASKWVFNSHPIRVGDPARDIEVEEVVIWASRNENGVGTCTILVTLENDDGTLSQAHGPFTVTEDYTPQAFRFGTSSGADNFSFQITAENSDDDTPAPIVHRLDIKYKSRNLKANSTA